MCSYFIFIWYKYTYISVLQSNAINTFIRLDAVRYISNENGWHALDVVDVTGILMHNTFLNLFTILCSNISLRVNSIIYIL